MGIARKGWLQEVVRRREERQSEEADWLFQLRMGNFQWVRRYHGNFSDQGVVVTTQVVQGTRSYDPGSFEWRDERIDKLVSDVVLYGLT